MRRRQFLAGSVAAGLLPLASSAQQKPPLVVLLSASLESDEEVQRRLKAFEQSLAAAGWKQGQNIKLERRLVGNDPARIQKTAIEIVASKPDVILAVSSLALAPIRRQTDSIPIVFTNIADPVGSGFVASLANPGGNVTGFTPAEFTIYGKLLETLKEAVPRLTRVAVLFNPEQVPQMGMLRSIESVAVSLGVRAIGMPVRGSIGHNLMAFAKEGNDGLIVLPNPVANEKRDLIIRTANRLRLPSIFGFRYFVTAGGLMSYGINPADQYKLAASYVDRILKGAKPADLPVQQPTKFELVINLKTAKTLGLTIPPTLLARADEVIE